MKQLSKRGQQIARARKELAMRLITARLEEHFRNLLVDVEQDRIRISGTGMVKRWLTETQLRFVSSLVK